uniref:4-hydroxybenzoate polyprenyltransferase, mitochondrial n=1 Tax=Panagrellus redivivus TaxID=6233 RepID=A0A7E4V4Z0_PANRE
MLALRRVAPLCQPQRSCLLYATSSTWTAPRNWRQIVFSPAATLVQAAPDRSQPYLRLMRFDKPTGTFLLFWPGAWGIALATPAGHLPDLRLLGIFAAGSFLMRGAACTINDLWDRRFDALVARTADRPLASGALNTVQAIGLLAVLLSGSLGCLLLLNPLTVVIGMTAIIPTIAYPLAKRYTYWPQVALGATINYSAIMGFTAALSADAIANSSMIAILPLYASTIFWTLIYDTIYAHQDKEDDLKIGVKSSALCLQDRTKPWLAGFAAAMITNLSLAGAITGQSWPFYAAVSATAAQLTWQIATVNTNSRADCWTKFNSNQWVGALILAGLITGTFVKQ